MRRACPIATDRSRSRRPIARFRRRARARRGGAAKSFRRGRLPVAEALRVVAMADAPEDAGLGEREHRARVRRFRYVLGIGLFLWNAIGIPNDRAVTELFGLSYT